MLDALITSRTRLKLLLRFFLNASTSSYLRNLEDEFGESTNAIRVELNRLEEAGLLTSEMMANRKVYKANTSHPLFPDINNIIRKYLGIDKLVEEVLAKLGDVKEVYLTGQLARGINSDTINLLIVSDSIDIDYLNRLVNKAGQLISRKITYAITPAESAPAVLENIPDKLLIYKP
ncbi:MAG: ArsR family transcriptional regulator [Firmicutes bacterium]|nr:ArsR family transcriptional regulator [Bacillota bacterium]